MDPYPRTWAEIDLPALGRNLTRVRGIVGSAVKVALVAKADAYGHGLIPVCRYAVRNGADWIAVATVQEGIALRDSGIDSTILVLSPMLDIEAEQAVFYGFDIVERLSALLRATLSRRRANEVRLEDELDVVRQYLAIEQARGLARLVGPQQAHVGAAAAAAAQPQDRERHHHAGEEDAGRGGDDGGDLLLPRQPPGRGWRSRGGPGRGHVGHRLQYGANRTSGDMRGRHTVRFGSGGCT